MLDKVDVKKLIAIAREAGEAIMEIYLQEFDVELKDDRSPLTNADRESNDIILSRLRELYPDIPYISEETKQMPYQTRKEWNYFWLIDPLDGTKEFIKKNGEFTVNIALIEGNQPIMGVVHVPAKNITYYSVKGQGSYKIENTNPPVPIKAKQIPDTDTLIVVGSRSHATPELQQFVEEKKKEYKTVEFIAAGSSLKFCLVAEGKADIYPRTGPTMEWDTAAGHALVLESGKQVVKFNSSEPLLYNKENLLNDWFTVK